MRQEACLPSAAPCRSHAVHSANSRIAQTTRPPAPPENPGLALIRRVLDEWMERRPSPARGSSQVGLLGRNAVAQGIPQTITFPDDGSAALHLMPESFPALLFPPKPPSPSPSPQEQKQPKEEKETHHPPPHSPTPSAPHKTPPHSPPPSSLRRSRSAAGWAAQWQRAACGAVGAARCRRAGPRRRCGRPRCR